MLPDYDLRLRTVRRARRLSQRALSLRSGVAQNTISEIESGKRQPNLWTVVLLAKGLEIASLDELVVIRRTLSAPFRNRL